MVQAIENVNNVVNGAVWGLPGLILLIGTGILLTIGTKVFQLSHLGHWWKNTIVTVFKKNSTTTKTNDKKNISQFQALCAALAATVGTGNIAGVAAAIVTGGPGAVFWMWVAAFFGMMTNFSENVLGIYYRRKNPKGEWSGGAMYYLKDGLGKKKGMKGIANVLAVLFACFAILASFGIGNMAQINKIVLNMDSAFFPETRAAHVVVDSAPVYDAAHVSAILSEGTQVEVSDKTAAYYVILQNKQTGYVAADYITEETDEDGNTVYRVTAKTGALVYDDATTVNAVTTLLSGSESVQTYQYRGDWWKVTKDGQDGYIFREFVELDRSLGGVPYEFWIAGAALMILAALIIIGGLKRIAKFAEIVVPFMAVVYVIGALVIFAVNIENVGTMFAAIFKFAFKPAAFLGGGIGVLIKVTMTQGFKRGVFSNEAGLGSSVMVHSSSNVKEPVRQGMWGIFEVLFDTFVVCTMTAVVVLSTGYIDLTTGAPLEGVSGDTLVSEAFGQLFGSFGSGFVAVAMLFFAFTTVLGWSQYGSKAVEYLFGQKGVTVYKFIFVAMIIAGAVMEGGLAWDLSDTFNGLMMIPNLIAVLALSPLVIKIVKNYVDRRIKNKDVAPMLSYDPAIEKATAAALKKEDD